jgi:hypothetical protein
MYKIRREIGQNNTPIEWEEWAGLTEKEVSKFLDDNVGNPAWYGRQVRIVDETSGEQWTENEWEWDHAEDDYFGEEDDEVEEDDLSYLDEIDN